MALNKRLIGWFFLALAAPCGHAQSEVYKCPDASGRPTYTNVKRDPVGKTCTLLAKALPVVPAQAPPRAMQSATAPASTAARDANLRSTRESHRQHPEHQPYRPRPA